LRLKLLLFILLDINYYIGNNDFIIYKYNKFRKIYDIATNNGFFDYNNFKVEGQKKDLKFYDPDNNMVFFNRLYMLIGIIPYTEDPLELSVCSDSIITIKDMLDNFNDSLDSFCNLTLNDRGWHYFISKNEEEEVLLIEKEVEIWIIEFLERKKQDWAVSLDKETIEVRNWRLLNEIEELFLLNK